MTYNRSDPSEILNNAVKLYLHNMRKEALEVLSVEKYIKETGGKFVESPDASSVLKGFIASIGLLEGMLSGSADSLAVIVEEFWETEKLANNSPDKEWIGNRVSRGLSYMLGGILQVFMGRYVKGGLNVAISFKLVRDLEQDVLAISSDSKDGYIRSLGLLVLSLMNFFAQVLPASITSAGELLGLGISKEKFYHYIEMCHKENGVFAYIAKLVLVQTTINSKNFVFDHISKDELSHCRTLINECLVLGPDSVIVNVINASVCLGEGDIKGASKTLSGEAISRVISLPEWSNMELAVGYKLGVVHLCDFEFDKAQTAFKRAADAIARRGRWHYLPFMRALEGLSYLAFVSVSGAPTNTLDEVRKTAMEIFAETLLDRDLSDGAGVVLPGDHWGARSGYEQCELLQGLSDKELGEFISSKGPVSNVLYALLSVLYHFEKINREKLEKFMHASGFLESAKKYSTGIDQTDYKIKSVVGEYYRKIGEYGKSVAAFDDAIEEIDHAIENLDYKDKDTVLGFSLVLQGAALAASGDTETAKEVLADLSDVLTESTDIIGGIVGSFSSTAKSGKKSNLVKANGGEFDLVLNFRKNGLKQKLK